MKILSVVSDETMSREKDFAEHQIY